MSAIQDLSEYVKQHAIRGTCTCGKCIDHPGVDNQPTGHTADMVFFQVANNGGDADKLYKLVTKAKEGVFCNVDLFDREEHSYLELGEWIGDQGLALLLMGLGTVLGVWDLMTPKTFGMPEPVVLQMAEMGLVTIIYRGGGSESAG